MKKYGLLFLLSLMLIGCEGQTNETPTPPAPIEEEEMIELDLCI